VAGGSAELLFTRDAVVAIHEHSLGIPRTISVICDNALVNGFAADLKPVGRDVVLDVCRDFEFAQPLSEQFETRAPAGKPPDTNPSTSSRPEGAPAPRAGARAAGDSQPMFSDFTRPKRFSFF
jgi:hypothetical protein